MSGPIYFHIRLLFLTPASMAVWRERVLLAQLEYLKAAPGFGFIDMADDDLLGDEMTVTEVRTLEEALSYLVSVGCHIDDAYRARIIEWGSTVMEGKVGVRFVLAGPLPRSATVSDLLAYLQSPGIENGLIEALPSDDATVLIHGFLPEYEAYRHYRQAMVYAGAAASQLGAEGTVSFVGPGEELEYVATFADFQDGATTISEPDVQDLTDEGLLERFGGIDFVAVLRSWTEE
jgi:hypothetical protein